MSSSPGSPRRQPGMIVLSILVVLGLSLFMAACGVGAGVGDGGAVSTGDTSDTTVTEPAGPGETTTTDTEGSGAGVTTSTAGGSTDSSASGSGGSSSGTTQTTAASSTSETMTVNVYFARDEKMAAAARTIPKTQSSGAAAMNQLLQGPTAVEKQGGSPDIDIAMVTAIPEGTRLLGLNIKNGVATVDLSKEYASGGGSLSMMMRLAQVVFTLTQFPSVQGVEFMLDGKPIDVLGGEGIIIDHPMTRADYDDLAPAILVESPTLGASVASPVRIWGTANTFEAMFRINITDKEGLIIADEPVMATSGSGTRGTFDVTVDYPSGHAGRGALIVFENSAKDGSPIHVVEIPLVLK